MRSFGGVPVGPSASFPGSLSFSSFPSFPGSLGFPGSLSFPSALGFPISPSFLGLIVRG